MYNDKKMFDDLRLAIWMHKISACNSMLRPFSVLLSKAIFVRIPNV